MPVNKKYFCNDQYLRRSLSYAAMQPSKIKVLSGNYVLTVVCWISIWFLEAHVDKL